MGRSHYPASQRWFGLRKFLIRAFWTGVCLSVAFVLWALWYVNDRGFTRKWRRMLTTELKARGVQAHIGRLTLNPLRGLVAKEVRIMHSSEHERVLAYISEIVLDINYSNLVHGLPFVNAVDLRNAQLSLPLGPGDSHGEKLEVARLNARVLLPPGQLCIDQLEADVHGLHVSAKGRLMNPGQWRPSASSDPHSKERAALRVDEALQFLDRLKIAGGKPNMEIRFEGDLANPSELFVETVIRSGKFTVGDYYQVRSAQITAVCTDGLIRLGQCTVIDDRGELDASGTFHLATGEVDGQLRSTLGLQNLAKSLHLTPLADDLVFGEPPLLELGGQAVFKPKEEGGIQGRVTGRFSARRFTAKQVVFEKAGADFSWDGKRWFVRDARLAHGSGTMAVTALSTPQEFRFSFDSSIDPKVFLPFLPPKGLEILSEWDFAASPVFHLEGRGPSLAWETLDISGNVAFGRTRFRKVGFDSLVSSLRLKDKIITFPDFKLERPEGKGSGAFAFDIGQGIATLTGVKSTLTPVDVAVWVDHDGNLPRNLAPYRFRNRPNLAIDGTVQIHDRSEHTHLRIGVDGSNLDYTFIKKDLFFPKIKGTLWIIRDRLKIEDLEATTFGGTLKGNADISLEHGKGDYTTEVHVDNIDFPSLTKLYFGYDTSKGKLRGDAKFSGRGDVARAITGSGSLTVTDGNVFGIPLFGPFSGILNEILPGTGYNVARKASADFDMKSGVIHTGNLLVEGKGFSMMGGGKLFFLDDKIDFSIRINAQGAAGMLLAPVSHLFEYVSDSTLSKPIWRPKRLPKGMFAQ